MFIHSIETKTLSIPLKKAFATNLHILTKIECISIVLRTTSDITGYGFLYGFGKTSVQNIVNQIQEIYFLLRKENIFLSQENWLHFWKRSRFNPSEAFLYAIAIIDIAVWDILAKEKQTPLHQLLGSKHQNTNVPVYATTGWLSLNTKELIKECEKFAYQGINGFKVRLGRNDDFQRLKSLRYAMGDKFILMVDANRRYCTYEAISIAKRLMELNITWFEEPVGDSFMGLKTVSLCSPIPIAIGENIKEIKDFIKVSKNQTVKFLQPDIARCRGISGFIPVANISMKHGLSLCHHLFPQLFISLIGAFKNRFMLEYDDFFPDHFFKNDFSLKNGCLSLPLVSGVGLEVTDYFQKKFNTQRVTN